MNVDHFYRIGKGHSVCEDYAISGMNPIPHAILSDGCSSSKDTDVGARMLCHLAKANSQVGSIRNFIALMCRDMDLLSNVIEIDFSAFDATLCMLSISKNIVDVLMFGDGFVIDIGENHEVTVSQIEYESNAPFYLSYRNNNEKIKAYINGSLGKKTNRHFILNSDGYLVKDSGRMSIQNFEYPFIDKYKANEWFKTILLASDGLSSFVRMDDSYHIPVHEVIAELVSFKSLTGEFLKRRMNRMLKDFAKDGIFPMDDVSVAGIHFGD